MRRSTGPWLASLALIGCVTGGEAQPLHETRAARAKDADAADAKRQLVVVVDNMVGVCRTLAKQHLGAFESLSRVFVFAGAEAGSNEIVSRGLILFVSRKLEAAALYDCTKDAKASEVHASQDRLVFSILVSFLRSREVREHLKGAAALSGVPVELMSTKWTAPETVSETTRRVAAILTGREGQDWNFLFKKYRPRKGKVQ